MQFCNNLLIDRNPPFKLTIITTGCYNKIPTLLKICISKRPSRTRLSLTVTNHPLQQLGHSQHESSQHWQGITQIKFISQLGHTPEPEPQPQFSKDTTNPESKETGTLGKTCYWHSLRLCYTHLDADSQSSCCPWRLNLDRMFPLKPVIFLEWSAAVLQYPGDDLNLQL